MSEAPRPGRTARRLTRRDLLRVAGFTGLVVTVAGCSSVQSGRTSTGESSSRMPADLLGFDAADDDLDLVVVAIADEQGLLDGCSRAVAAYPFLRGPVASARAAQRVHLAVLRGALSVSGPSAPTTQKAVARPRQAALDGLVSDFAGAQQRRLHDCLAASSGPLARLFASIAASHAVTSGLLADAA